jgi:hypothetical protein
MAGLAILKLTYDLSDEVLCERWVENKYFCGEEFFQHRLVFDRSSMTRLRNRMGEDRLQTLLQESLSVATKTEAIKPSELPRVIVATTVPTLRQLRQFRAEAFVDQQLHSAFRRRARRRSVMTTALSGSSALCPAWDDREEDWPRLPGSRYGSTSL